MADFKFSVCLFRAKSAALPKGGKAAFLLLSGGRSRAASCAQFGFENFLTRRQKILIPIGLRAFYRSLQKKLESKICTTFFVSEEGTAEEADITTVSSSGECAPSKRNWNEIFMVDVGRLLSGKARLRDF